jgi:hypothetical protein
MQLTGSETDVWVLGTTDFNARQNVVARWDGTAWTSFADNGFFYATAAGSTDIWLSGEAGKLARWDGAAFTPISSGVTTATLGPMWGGASDDVWIVQAGSPSLWHWDGSSLSPIAVAAAVASISGTARDDVWAAGAAIFHYDGTSWINVPAPNVAALRSITAVARDLAWAQSGTEILRWDGASWTPESAIPPTSVIAGRARDNVWSYTTGVPPTLRHWDGTAWSTETAPSVPITTLWVDPGGTLWAAGDSDRILRLDTCGWRFMSGAIHHSEAITGIWASGPVVRMIGSPYGDLYGVDGCGLTKVSALNNDASKGLGGAAADDLWIVGSYGMIEHFDGAVRTLPPQPSEPTLPTLHGVWARASDDAWAVGERGRITHWDGQTWTDVASPTTSWLTAVWGTSATDVWAVGDAGTLLHWDGTSWTLESSRTQAWLGSVWAIGDEVWAVGEAGTILHRAHGTWLREESGTNATLMAIRGRSRVDVWTVGEHGTVLRDQAAGWHPVATATDATLTAVGLGDVTWVGGAGALVMFQ